MSKYMVIDGEQVEFDSEPNILAVVRKAGIELPTFCYYPELSIYGACRMCVVEDERGGIIASCSTPPKDGMVIRTNTAKLHHHRKMILELLLASHCRDCTTCDKSGKCRLQEFAARFGVDRVRFKGSLSEAPLDTSSKAIVRDPSKCILCGDCVRMCSEVQNVGAIDFAHRGSKMIVSPAFGKPIAETNCVNCGQCAAVCPTGAITIKSDTEAVFAAIHDPKKRVVVQVAPAVRVAIGEEFGLAGSKDEIGKIFSALHQLGFDAAFDTSLSADLTIMEEAAELLHKLSSGDNKYPLFTSCCPGWIRYAETKHPELMSYISTCKSPMQMFAAVLREHFAPMDAEDGRQTISVAIMPCTAKKFEASREEFITDGRPDVDFVLTTTEFARMIREVGIRFDKLSPALPDEPFSTYSGAGVIFGVTGGVTEAAVRRVVDDKGEKSLETIEYLGLRGLSGTKVCELPYGEKTLRIAVVNGLGNAEQLIQKIESGEEHFDFVEVMACPGGCIAGGGQPYSLCPDKAGRAQGIADTDHTAPIKHCEKNPVIASLYEGMLKDRAHELLHVHYHAE